jgi:hypothetical protein
MTDDGAGARTRSVNPYEAPSEGFESSPTTLGTPKAVAGARALRLLAVVVDGLLTVTPALPGVLFLTFTPGPEDLKVGHWVRWPSTPTSAA